MFDILSPTAQSNQQAIDVASSVQDPDRLEIAVSIRSTDTVLPHCVVALSRLGMQLHDLRTQCLPEPPGVGSAVLFMSVQGPQEKHGRAVSLMGNLIDVYGINVLPAELSSCH